MFELSVDQQAGLFVHLLRDGVGHQVVGLEPAREGCAAVLIVHVLLGMPAQGTPPVLSGTQLVLHKNRKPVWYNGGNVVVYGVRYGLMVVMWLNMGWVILLYDVADVHLRHLLAIRIWDLLLLLLLHWSGGRLRLLLFLLRAQPFQTTQDPLNHQPAMLLWLYLNCEQNPVTLIPSKEASL